jgi:hypothetical protein
MFMYRQKESKMLLRKMVQRLDAWAAFVVTGLVMATPAYAFTLHVDRLRTLPMRDWLLAGSLVLLAVALALRLMRRDTDRDAPADAPDLRWWRNP